MRFLLCVLLVLGLVGCRESLLTPEEGAEAPRPVATDDVAVGFLKGPDVVRFGETAEFKAPEDALVSYYYWYQSGTGSFRIYSSAERVVTFEALGVGEVALEYVAYRGNGTAQLRGTRTVEIVP